MSESVLSGPCYVYALCDPRKPLNDARGLPYEPFYIGKGTDRRVFAHFRNGVYQNTYNPHKTRKLKRIREVCGREALIVFIRDGLTEAAAYELEFSLVRMWGRLTDGTGVLTNVTAGGAALSDKAYTPEVIRKVAAARMGVPLSEAHKESIRRRALGRRLSNETKEKIRMARLASAGPVSDETREKLRLAHSGKSKPDGFGQRVREAKQGKSRPDNAGRQSKQVSMYGVDGMLLATYPSARNAMDVTGINYKAISACCTGARITCWMGDRLVTFRFGSSAEIERLSLASRGRHVCSPPRISSNAVVVDCA